MGTCCTCCNCIEKEIEVISVYANFKDKTLLDCKEMMFRWCNENSVDLNQVIMTYIVPTYGYLQKYRSQDIENIKWLYQLGLDRINFYKEYDKSQIKNWEDLYNYNINNKSIVLFLGEFNRRMEEYYFRYIAVKKVPIVLIKPDKYEVNVWTHLGQDELQFIKSTVIKFPKK